MIPRLDFAVLPLEERTVRPILNTVLDHNRFETDVIHIKIEKHGKLQFASYDNFSDDAIVCFLGIPPEFLNDLTRKGILRSWTTPHEGAVRWHG